MVHTRGITLLIHPTHPGGMVGVPPPSPPSPTHHGAHPPYLPWCTSSYPPWQGGYIPTMAGRLSSHHGRQEALFPHERQEDLFSPWYPGYTHREVHAQHGTRATHTQGGIYAQRCLSTMGRRHVCAEVSLNHGRLVSLRRGSFSLPWEAGLSLRRGSFSLP